MPAKVKLRHDAVGRTSVRQQPDLRLLKLKKYQITYLKCTEARANGSTWADLKPEELKKLGLRNVER